MGNTIDVLICEFIIAGLRLVEHPVVPEVVFADAATVVCASCLHVAHDPVHQQDDGTGTQLRASSDRPQDLVDQQGLGRSADFHSGRQTGERDEAAGPEASV